MPRSASSEPAPTPQAIAASFDPFPVGDLVEAVGLSCESLNGKQGKVVRHYAGSAGDRIGVDFGEECGMKAIHPRNLVSRQPPRPRSPPRGACPLCQYELLDPVSADSDCQHALCRSCVGGMRYHGITAACTECRPLERDGDGPQADLRAGAVLLVRAVRAQGDPREQSAALLQAEAKLRRAVRGDPALASARFALAETLRQAAQLKKVRWGGEALRECEGLLEEALALDPACVNALCCLAAVRKQAGDAEGAREKYEATLRIDADCLQARCGLAALLLEGGDIAASLPHWRVALEKRPEHAEAHCGVGACLEQQGDSDGAIAAYRRALAADSRHVLSRYNLGVALAKKGDKEAARAELRAAGEAGTSDASADALCFLGAMLGDDGDSDGACRCFRSCLKLRPAHADAWHNLGVELAMRGDVEEAAAAFRQALAAQPGHPAAQAALAHLTAGAPPEPEPLD